MEITEKIKTVEDALKATGKPNVPEFSDVPEEMREYFKAQYKAIVITEALNEGWEPDYEDPNQPKYVPYFWVSPSGFVFNYTYYYISFPYAGDASRLCFKTRALALYAGKQFTDIYKTIILK